MNQPNRQNLQSSFTRPLSRRTFTLAGGLAFLSTSTAIARNQDPAKADPPKANPPTGPVEAPFERDYDPPSFKPSWKNPQLNRLLVQDFVIFAHSDLDMVKKLLEREPKLLNAAMDWGNGDWETALGGASHMGRRDVAEFLLSQGARIDLFCAAMMGQLEAVKSFLTLQPNLIDAKGPHGFSLHVHAQAGGEQAAPVLDYLQSLKQIELRPLPFMKQTPK